MKYGYSTAGGIGTTICRIVDGEVINFDIWITFTATCIDSGYKGSYYDPPSSPQWEFEIVEIAFDLPKGIPQSSVEGGPLTADEVAALEAWFEGNLHLADEAIAESCDDYYEGD